MAQAIARGACAHVGVVFEMQQDLLYLIYKNKKIQTGSNPTQPIPSGSRFGAKKTINPSRVKLGMG